jgi:hypothetical protein
VEIEQTASFRGEIVKSKQVQDYLTPENDRVLDQQLALWAVRHSLSSARINAIHQTVLRQAEPYGTPLSLEWWDNFSRSLRSACQLSLNLSSSSGLSRITTTAAVG